MHRSVLVAALFSILVPALGAAETTLPVGKRLRLTTVRPQEDSSHANPARVLGEDANSITLVPAPGEAPITWTKEGRWLMGTVVAADERRLVLQADIPSRGGSEPAYAFTSALTAAGWDMRRPQVRSRREFNQGGGR